MGVAVTRIQIGMGDTRRAEIRMCFYALDCPFVCQGGAKGVNLDFDVLGVRNGGIRSNIRVMVAGFDDTVSFRRDF